MRMIGAALLLLSSTTVAAAAPNIVVIMTDDQEDTGSMAYMPKVHALLAEHGVTFTNSFVNVSLCCPSRASFLTGQSAHNHGIRSNSPVDGGGWDAFKDREPDALPVWLKAKGYTTALVGKYLNRYGQQSTLGSWLAWLGKYLGIDFKSPEVGNPADWVPPGWDLWYAFTGSRVRYFDYSINENGTILDFGHRARDYSTDVLKERAVRFIAEQSGTAAPFFMLIATKAVHAQGERAIPAPRHEHALENVRLPTDPAFNQQEPSKQVMRAPRVKDEAALEQNYRAELQSLQSVDDLVEAVVSALQSAGKLDDTLIIYTSDNGFLFGAHRLVGKVALYEGSIRVPLVIRGPDIPQGGTREQLVSNLDVVATIEDLALAAPGVAPDGRSLMPLFADAHAPWRSAVQIESPVTRFDHPASRFAGVRTATRKYVKYDGGFEELFDLGADPHELKNEAGNASYASDLTALRALNDALKSCAGTGCWAP
jgi:N-acetylglucosamine-6-sulfatase